MADRKFTVSSGDEIIVRISGKSKTVVGGKSPRRKAMIRSRRPDEPLPRRLKKGGINFYDLAYVKSGAGFADLDLAIVKDPIINEPTNTYTESIPPFTLADFNSADDIIFEIPFAEWKQKFFRLTRAATIDALPISSGDLRYVVGVNTTDEGFTLTDETPQWTNDGLNLPSAQVANGLNVGSQGVGLSFNRYFRDDFYLPPFPDWELYTKITAVRDFAAPSVDFTPTARMDIFLLPDFVRFRGTSSLPDGDYHFLNVFAAPVPRAQFIRHYQPADALFMPPRGVFNLESQFGGSISHPQVLRSVAVLTSLPPSRTLINTASGGETYTPSIGDGAAFGGINETGDRAEIDEIFGATPNGILLAVISQNGNWFYVWKNIAP